MSCGCLLSPLSPVASQLHQPLIFPFLPQRVPQARGDLVKGTQTPPGHSSPRSPALLKTPVVTKALTIGIRNSPLALKPCKILLINCKC